MYQKPLNTPQWYPRLRAEREKAGLTDEIEQQIFNSGNVPQTRKHTNALLAMVDANTAKNKTASCRGQ